MKLRLSRADMLAQWKMRRYLEPLRQDCLMSRSDGIDLDAYCVMEMRRWYLDLMATAPMEYLAPSDLTLTATVRRGEGNRGLITLPAGTVRIVRVKLSGWQREATVVTDMSSPLARLQRNRFSCGGVERPVALWSGEGSVLELFSLPSLAGTPVVEALTAVVDPGPELYEFDERAWNMLPE